MSADTGVETSGNVAEATRDGNGRRGRHAFREVVRPVRCRFRTVFRDQRVRWSRRFGVADRGMTTSEYAMGTIAACAFAAVLYKVVNSGAVQNALQSLIEGALDGSF